MRTKNAAPSLQAEEAVAATDEHIITMPLPHLVADFMAIGEELRWRVMDMPNPALEKESGECRHDAEMGCSWRCERRIGQAVTPERVRDYLRNRLGPALFAVLDGYGEELRSITMVGCEHADAIAKADRTIATLQERSREWQLALVSLTPGGSEFADDPAACVAWVRESRKGERDALMRALARERVTISTLRKALERYGRHEPTCAFGPMKAVAGDYASNCTCGFSSAALDEKEG